MAIGYLRLVIYGEVAYDEVPYFIGLHHRLPAVELKSVGGVE
jgi:hypothetical protein